MVALAGKGWKLAPALVQLYDEANAIAPERVRLADGSIGDQAHAARKSHHNPQNGYVDGIDITHSPAYGWDCEERVQQILGDPRLEYVIFSRRIWRGYDKPGLPRWTQQTYTGSNTHQHHMHVSVWRDDRRLVSTPWWPTNPKPTEDDEMYAQLILFAYREAKRDPNADPKGVTFWLKQLDDGNPMGVVNECRKALGLAAI